MTSTSNASAVVVDDLVVRRGNHTAIARLSTRMDAGRVTGVLGPSGSGKSTLLRSIVGVQKITSGAVTVLGQPAGAHRLRASIGYQTQGNSVYADLTVIENVRYFATIVGAARDRVDQVISEVGLVEQRARVAANLSGGQLSRVNLACALVGDPQLLVLDEPTVGQDPVLREELWDGIRARAEQGAAVLVSSHVMDEANRCDDLVLVRAGRLLASGTPSEIQSEAGASNLDDAFLALVRRADSAGPAERSRDHDKEDVA